MTERMASGVDDRLEARIQGAKAIRKDAAKMVKQRYNLGDITKEKAEKQIEGKVERGHEELKEMYMAL